MLRIRRREHEADEKKRLCFHPRRRGRHNRNNDSDRSFRLRDVSLQIFKDYWANASYGTDETRGVFGRFEWSDVEFFLLDDRYHRSPNQMPLGADKVMFGAEQMRWLMDALRSSNATFKIYDFTSSPLTSSAQSKSEGS